MQLLSKLQIHRFIHCCSHNRRLVWGANKRSEQSGEKSRRRSPRHPSRLTSHQSLTSVRSSGPPHGMTLRESNWQNDRQVPSPTSKSRWIWRWTHRSPSLNLICRQKSPHIPVYAQSCSVHWFFSSLELSADCGSNNKRMDMSFRHYLHNLVLVTTAKYHFARPFSFYAIQKYHWLGFYLYTLYITTNNLITVKTKTSETFLVACLLYTSPSPRD